MSAGAAWADSPAAVAASSDVVFTMVGFPQDVRDVYFSEHGILAGAQPGTLFVDMTTTEPTLAREIQSRAVAKGCNAVDAPVSGGDVGARNKTLSIMVGGDADAVAQGDAAVRDPRQEHRASGAARERVSTPRCATRSSSPAR